MLCSLVHAQNPLHTFPCNFPIDGEIATCYELVADLLATRPTSWQQVFVMEFGKRHNTHNGLLPAPTCYGLVTNLSFMLRTCCVLATGKLPTCYGVAMGKLVTGVMDFGLYQRQLFDRSSTSRIQQRVSSLEFQAVNTLLQCSINCTGCRWNTVSSTNLMYWLENDRFKIYNRCPMLLWQYPPMPIPMPMWLTWIT